MFKAANPYDDIVTKATAETLTSEDWQTNLDICDKVSSEGETGARNCISAIQKRLVHRNANVQLYSITLSDALAKNAGIAAHRELASRNFTQTLARVVADRNTHDSVRKRVVAVLQEWAKDFDDGGDGSLGLVKETVEQLRQQGFTASVDQPAPEPAEPSSEQLRKEDEELRRVLELSMQDQGGRGATSYGGSASGDAAAASSSSKAPGSATAALLDKTLPNPNASETASSSRQPQQQQQQQQQQPTPSSASSAPAPAPAPAQPARPSRVRALYDFSPSEAGELPFSKGDIIRVLDSVYEHWWRGELRGEAGIFPVNYVEVLPDPTPEEIRREAEQEARIFQQAGDIDRLLARLRQLEAEGGQGGGAANLAEDEELQDLYQSSLAMRPRIVRLIDRYSGKVQELRALNDKFVRARGTFDAMMERSMAVHQPGRSQGQYMGVRPEYGYAGQQQAPPQQQGYAQQPTDPYQGQQHAYQGQAQPNGYGGQQPQQQHGASPHDAQAYAQWYQQQQQQQPQAPPQQQQQQNQPAQQAGYPAQSYPQQQQQPQHPQQQAEEEKQRLYEQARREAEAYHAAYGHPNTYASGAGGSGSGGAMANAPSRP